MSGTPRRHVVEKRVETRDVDVHIGDQGLKAGRRDADHPAQLLAHDLAGSKMAVALADGDDGFLYGLDLGPQS